MKRILFLTLMAVLSYTGIVWAQGDWQQLNPANSPPALSGFSMVTLPDGTVLVFGGVDESGQGVNDIWEFDQKEITWAKITPANEPPPARSGYCAWTRGGKMYIHGGKDFTGEALDDLWCFDPDTREWLKIQTGGTDRPSARFDHSANLLSDGSVLLLGGTDFLGSSLAELWRLNSDNTYTKLPDAPRGFFYHATQVAGNSLYVFGSPDWVYSYDLVQQTWSQSYGGPPVYNRPTTGFRRDAGEDIILIFGGIDKDGKESDVVYEYNVAQKTLSQRSERMPFPLTHSACSEIKDQSRRKLLFFGGESEGEKTDATFVFDGLSKKSEDWEELAPTQNPQALSGHSMVTLPDGTVLVFGGVDQSGATKETIWEFNQQDITWAKITPANDPPPARQGHCAWMQSGKMYVQGGLGENRRFFNDLWSFDLTTREWLEIQTGGTKPSARFGHSTDVLPDGSILILGGIDYTDNRSPELWQLNTDNTYAKLQNAPYEFVNQATQIVNDYLFVFSRPDWTYIYDFSKKTWSQGPVGPPLYGECTTDLRRDAGEDIILIFGGIDKDGKESDVVYEYNVAQKTLSQRSERMPFPLTHSASTGSGFQSASPQKALSAGVLEILFFGGISRGKTINATLKFSCESDSISSVETERTTEIPESFKLGQNYPNPFNPMTMIKYQLPKPAEVTIKIYNLQGQEILMVVNEQKEVGHFSVIWDGKDALGRMTASGIYLYRIEAIAGKDRFIQTKKMILLR